MALNTQFNNLSNISRVKLKGRKRGLGETSTISIFLMVAATAVYNHWTGLVDWAGGLDWWTDTKNHFYETYLPVGLHDASY